MTNYHQHFHYSTILQEFIMKHSHDITSITDRGKIMILNATTEIYYSKERSTVLKFPQTQFSQSRMESVTETSSSYYLIPAYELLKI